MVALPAPDEVLDKFETVQALKDSLDALPDQAKKCLILKYFHELSYNEIAEFLDVSVNTVKTHLKRGLQMLRERFKVAANE